MRADRQTKLICVFGEYANARSNELDEMRKEGFVGWCEVFACLYLEGLRKAMLIFRIASVSVALCATPNVGQIFACVQSYVDHSSLSETVGSCGCMLKHHTMVTCGGGGVEA
jgi:hypothetical protein